MLTGLTFYFQLTLLPHNWLSKKKPDPIKETDSVLFASQLPGKKSTTLKMNTDSNKYESKFHKQNFTMKNLLEASNFSNPNHD